jgi:DNA-binding XRE family transcriptional regulator
MGRPSSIDRLPAEIRAEIGRLRGEGHTIDQILAHLADMRSQVLVSRSAMGRHLKGFDRLAEKLRHSRVVAEALVRELGDAPESKTARLNIELLHGTINDLFINALDESGNGDLAATAAEALKGDPEGVMMLAKALDHLGRASKSNVDFLVAAEKRAREKAQAESFKAVEEVAKTAGLSRDTVETIKAKIFGVGA